MLKKWGATGGSPDGLGRAGMAATAIASRAMAAGYSGTALAKKLGIKEGHTIALLGAPTGFEAELAETLPDDVHVRRRASARADVDVIVTFHTDRARLVARVPALLATLDVDGGLWLARPKQSSGVPTDVTEDTVREVFLPLGLVDNKVCAIDDTWSGQRVVWRTDRRPALRAQRSL